jgi:hypothetical protein
VTRLVRVFCPDCGEVAATVERTEQDTRIANHSRVVIPTGSLVVAQQHTQAWSPMPEQRPTRKRLTTRIPVTATAGWMVVDCPRPGCHTPLHVDFGEMANVVAKAESMGVVRNLHPPVHTEGKHPV